MDEALLKWFINQWDRNHPATETMIQTKGNMFAERFAENNFVGSNFADLKRKRISCVNDCYEAANMCGSDVEKLKTL